MPRRPSDRFGWSPPTQPRWSKPGLPCRRLISRPLCFAAVDLHQRFQVSYWDAAILAAAKRLGCHTVFSEDMNDGQSYDGVTVVNPFRGMTT